MRFAEAIRKVTGDKLYSLGIVDVYQGEGIPKGKKSLAFSLQLQHRQHTLTDSEVEVITNKIVSHLEERHHAKLRE